MIEILSTCNRLCWKFADVGKLLQLFIQPTFLTHTGTDSKMLKTAKVWAPLRANRAS